MFPEMNVERHNCVQQSPLSVTHPKTNLAFFLLPGERLVRTLTLHSQDRLMATLQQLCWLLPMGYVIFCYYYGCWCIDSVIVCILFLQFTDIKVLFLFFFIPQKAVTYICANENKEVRFFSALLENDRLIFTNVSSINIVHTLLFVILSDEFPEDFVFVILIITNVSQCLCTLEQQNLTVGSHETEWWKNGKQLCIEKLVC